MIEVDRNGRPVVRAPVEFSGRVSEAQLEAWLIEEPDLAGEPLMVLGSQLAEFAEDKDRLDVLAVDETGELVLIELKVDQSFRVTDLQALAYAGAYASIPRTHLADVLHKHLVRRGVAGASIELARERIAGFVGVDGFDEWQPSQRVRIKLLAPGFPQRVLKTVKWLGDVYGMPIEAIEVKLFEDTAGCYHLTVERLLPVRGDDSFDLTVREAEVQKQTTNITRRPAVLPALLARGELQDGQVLYLHPRALYADAQTAFDPDSLVFQVVLDASAAAPRFRWRATPEDPEQLLAPSAAWHTMMESVFPGRYELRYWPVHSSYSVEPNGETLGDLAERTGAWAVQGDRATAVPRDVSLDQAAGVVRVVANDPRS
jgi:hypothetical protein